MARRKKTLNRNSSVRQAADDVMRSRSRGASSRVLDYIVEHRKIIMPAILAFCVLLTVALALLFNRSSDTPAGEGDTTEVTDVSDISLEVCTDGQINDLIYRYLAAYAAGDTETLEQITVGMTETDKIREQEQSRYVESYTVRNNGTYNEIYYKPGPVDNSHIVYVVADMKFYDYPTPAPAMLSYFVRQSEDGSYYIQSGGIDQDTEYYLKLSHLSSDVVDLTNRINAEYNELMDSDRQLYEQVSAMSVAINDRIAEKLAEEQNEIATANGEGEPTSTADDGERYLRATQVVNIRAEASTDAEQVGATNIGDVYKIIEDEGTWTKIEYNDGEAYVWTEYFELVTGSDALPAAVLLDPGVHVMNTTCNIREEASTDSDVIGQAVEGHSVEVVESFDNGWSKVVYEGDDGFIRTEYIDE